MPDRTYLSNQMKELRIRRDCALAVYGEGETRLSLCRMRVLPRGVPRGTFGGRLPRLQA